MNEKQKELLLPKKRNFAEQEAAFLELERKKRKQEFDQWIKDHEIDFSKAVRLIEEIVEKLKFNSFPFEFNIEWIIPIAVQRALQEAYRNAANLNLQFTESVSKSYNGTLSVSTKIKLSLIK